MGPQLIVSLGYTSKEIRSGFIRFVVDWMMEKPASGEKLRMASRAYIVTTLYYTFVHVNTNIEHKNRRYLLVTDPLHMNLHPP